MPIVRLALGVRPFVGGGAGAGIQSRPGSDWWEGSLHAVGGFRLRPGRGWGARAELRARTVHASGHMFAFGFGVIRGIF